MPSKTFRMILVCLLAGLCCTPSFAKKKKQHGAADSDVQIVEVSPMSVTVDAGKDVQETYSITAATKATLNGIAVTPDDLRAGMVAEITLAPDNQSVLTIAAKPAPRDTKKPVKPHDNVWINMH